MAAFILSAVLHVGPVVWVEMQQEKLSGEAGAPGPIHSVEEVTLAKGDGTTKPDQEAVQGDAQRFQ